jgi:cell division protein FtsX
MIFGESVRLFRSTFIASIHAVLAAGLMASLACISVLAALNVIDLTSRFRSETVLEVFLIDGVTEEQVNTLAEDVARIQGATGVDVKSPEQALDEMSGILESDLTEVLGTNPLPYSVLISFNPDSIGVDFLRRTATELADRDEVMEVHFPEDWLADIDLVTRGSLVAGILVSLLAVAGAVFVFVSVRRYAETRYMSTLRTLLLLGMRPVTARLILLVWGLGIGMAAGIFGLCVVAALWIAAGSYVNSFSFLPIAAVILAAIIPAIICGFVCLFVSLPHEITRRYRPRAVLDR